MAEYIDREKLKKHLDIEISFGGLENKLLVFDKIDTCDTADVIERSEYDKMVKSFKAMVEIKNENLIAMRDKYYKLEKEYAELKVNIDKAIKEISKLPTWDGNLDASPREVIEILKRNIGE